MSTYTEVIINDESELKAALSESGINWESWDPNQAKTVGDLLKEIKMGETLLLKDSKTNKLVRIVSAVWVKMLYAITEANKAKLLPSTIREDGNVLGNYYLIETCIHKQTGPTPFVNIQFKKESSVSNRYLTQNMVLPNYRGKPLAGKQTKSDVNVADVRSGAIKTALREIKEELNITLPADVFNEDIFVEWYPKKPSSNETKGGSKCDSPDRQNKCIQNSLKKQLVRSNSKLVTWEWVKEAPDAVKTNNGAQIPNIEQAMSSKSYPGLNTLYKIIHLRTKSLDNFNWGKKWIDAPGGVDDRRPPGLNEQASPEEVIQFYPPPFQPWQQDEEGEGNIVPLCFNVYETPGSGITISQDEIKSVINIQQRARSMLTKKNKAAAKIQAAVKGKKVRKNVKEIKEIDKKIAKQQHYKHTELKGEKNKSKRRRSNKKTKELQDRRAKLVNKLKAKKGGRRTRRRKRKLSKN